MEKKTNSNQESSGLEGEFLRSYFEVLRFIFDGMPEISDRDIETIVIPRLLALKTVVQQFDHTNPELAAELDHTVEHLQEILLKETDLDALLEQAFADADDDIAGNPRFS